MRDIEKLCCNERFGGIEVLAISAEYFVDVKLVIAAGEYAACFKR